MQEYLANPSRKVITRDEREVRIVCTDFKNSQPIIGLVATKDEEGIYFYYKDGRCFIHDETNLDLYFAPIKREGWINIYDSDSSFYRNIYKTKEDAIDGINENFMYLATIKIEWEE